MTLEDSLKMKHGKLKFLKKGGGGTLCLFTEQLRKNLSNALQTYLHAPSGISQWIQHVDTVRKTNASKTLAKIFQSHLVF